MEIRVDIGGLEQAISDLRVAAHEQEALRYKTEAAIHLVSAAISAPSVDGFVRQAGAEAAESQLRASHALDRLADLLVQQQEAVRSADAEASTILRGPVDDEPQ